MPQAFLQGGGRPRGSGHLARIERASRRAAAKNYAEADRIRKALEADGIILEDGPRGTTWRRS